MARGVSPLAALGRCGLFEGLAHADLVSIGLVMRSRHVEAGTALHHAGRHGDRMYVIVDGLANVLPAAAAPQGGAPAARLRRGDVTGAASLLTGEPHASTVVAATTSELLELGREDFDALAERFPVILTNALRILSQRLARSYGGEDRPRGEVVGLVFAAALAPAVPAVMRAAVAASARPVAVLDTRSGLHDVVAQLDDRLDEGAGTVVVAARAEGRSAPLLLDHVDRVVLLVEDEGQAERFVAASGAGGALTDVVVAGPGEGRAARPGHRSPDGPSVARVLARGDPGGPLSPEASAWLGRLLTRTRLGLALGAGGAKGYAHVGVLRVLEQAGYTIDAVAGSSIGAIVGAYVALGLDAGAIERTLRAAFDEDAVAAMFRLSLAGTSTGLEVMTRILRETTGERSFGDLDIPLVAMAVDLTHRAPAPQSEGPLWEALLAATALAGMFPPQERDGARLVDGLALVPVPTEATYAAGADVVVSVNLMPRTTLEAWPGHAPPPPAPERRGARLLETILEVMDLSQLEESNRHAELADVVVTPRFGPASWRDFQLADLFLTAGEEAARDRLGALRARARPAAVGAHADDT